jgi:type II secretory pathway component PulM
MNYQKLLGSTLTHALNYIESLDKMPVSATASLSDLRKRLNRPLTDKGIDAIRVIDELVDDVKGGF